MDKIKTFFKKLQKEKEYVNTIDMTNLNHKIKLKINLYTLLLLVIIMIPFLIIFLTVMFQLPPKTPLFYLFMVVIGLTILFLMPLNTIIYYKLLKNYFPEREDINKIVLKYLFLKELTNFFNIIMVVAIMVIATLLIIR